MSDRRALRYLVTGAGGFIGRHLVRQLAARRSESEIVGLSRSRPASPWPASAWLALDLAQPDAVAALAAHGRFDMVFHLAAAGANQPNLPLAKAAANNLTATDHLLQALFGQGAGPTAVILARTPGESAPRNPYQATKAAAWNLAAVRAQSAGWPVVGATLHQVYGPDQAPNALIPSAFRAALAGHDLPLTPGDQIRDWVHVDDAVDGLLALAERPLAPATSVAIGVGVGTSVADVVKLIYALADGGGRPLIGALPQRPGAPAYLVADAERTERLTGWRAPIRLADGLKRLHAGLA